MTVSGIGATSQALTNAGVDQTSGQNGMQATLGPVAQLFGMSTSQLDQALQSGESLNDIASAKGVSQSDLIAAISQGIQQSQPPGTVALSATQLTNLANRIAGHHHHHHGGGGGGSSSSSTTSSTNPLSAVDQDVDQLLQDLTTALSSNGSTSINASGTGTTPLDPLTQSVTIDQQL
ncbi:MAG: hypothetical protein ACLPVY_24940 [Acidimicrobiia bacterium]